MTEFAYPQHVGWVPMKLFAINMSIGGLLAVLLRNVAQGLGIFGAFAVFVGIHVFVAMQFRKDPFIEQVWMQHVLPPDFTKPGKRRVLRTRTRNMRLELGRKYTV
jgi:hypothetical protein